MNLIRFFLFQLVFIFLTSGIYGQRITQFSEESDKFLNELEDMFSKITLKENKEKAEVMMGSFTEYWNTGVYSKELKENVKSICNMMLKRRLRSYPHFYHYLSSMNGLMEYDHSEDSYAAWHKSVVKLVNDKRSTKHITTFLQTSYNLLTNNVLYSTKGVTWRANTTEFSFVNDSVPEVVFEDLTLTCYANKDSSVIYNTKGRYFPLKSRWYGSKGKIDWKRAGFGPDEIYALIEDYEIYMAFSKYSIDSVAFYNKRYLNKPLLGTLEEKVLANVVPEKATYPRFTSYVTHVEIRKLFEDVNFIGGIEMRGVKLIGKGNTENNAKLTFIKDGKDFVKIQSDNFVIYPDRISSYQAKATIMMGEDSIFHPGLQMSYMDEKRELSLIRSGDGKTKSPYYDSFHNIDIYSEAIYWNMNEPNMDFEAIKGVSGIGLATFESSSYFSEARYMRLQGIDERNPLNVIRNYTNVINSREIHVEGLSREMRISQDQVIALLVTLASKGFVLYDRDTKIAIVKDRLYDYIDAVNEKIDYDVIQFNSETFRSQNASLELDSFGLRLYGVPVVILSDSQNVVIFPENEQLVLKKGMDFAFSGRVHAGNFDFFAEGCDFVYDQFKLDMPVITGMSFKVPSFEKNEYGERPLVRVRSIISDLGGDLYIDHPNNKSGLKMQPQYPIFNSTKDAYVYYDDESIFNGVYDRERFYFYLYPFSIDSLDNFKTELLEFNGYLASAGIFPDIADTLKVQRDYSLGFLNTTPPEGYAMYGGKGSYYSNIHLSNDGLRGDGSIHYLTSTSESNDFMLFPDSCNAFLQNFEIAEQLTPIEYPTVKGVDVNQHWMPYLDMMIVKPNEIPFAMFLDQSELQGPLVLTPEKLRGAGRMSFEDAEMNSKMYTFKHHEIFADSADFNLTSSEFAQSAFSTTNYNSHIDFFERKGEFVSNGGASYVDFPVNLYTCLIDEFKWFMDSYQIAIGSPEKEAEMARYDNLPIQELIDIPLEGSEFISTHPDQDSLSFISTVATYNLREYILEASDVKYLRIADAAIFPSDKYITVKQNAVMNTIADAKILTNTVTRYHEIYDAVVDIKGKKRYNGIGNYDYVDQKGDRQSIFLRDIGVDLSSQTVGSGYVSDSVGFTLSNNFDFAGSITLNANNPHLNFRGGFMIHNDCDFGKKQWVKFDTDINPDDIYIDVNEKLTDISSKKLEAALMFSSETNKFYSAFLTNKKSTSDQPVVSSHGKIRFDDSRNEYKIASHDKLKGITMGGDQLTLQMKQCILIADGRVDLGASLGKVNFESFGKATHSIIPETTSFELVAGIDFPFEDKALELMMQTISTSNLQGVNLTSSTFLKALTDILGESNAEKTVADIRLFGKFRKYPSELEHTIFFSEVKLEWNPATRSYISTGPIGVGSIGKEQVNKYLDGYIEIARKRTGDVVNIYLEIENGKHWYYFNYRNNLMQSISSNTEYNNMIRDLKDDKRTVKGGKNESDYRFIISNLRKKTDFLRRIRQ